jgi:hypothetical protein
MLCVNTLGGLMSHVVAAPDIERALLEQEGEADREQHLTKHIVVDRDNGNAAQYEKRDDGGDRDGGNKLTPARANSWRPAGNRQSGRPSIDPVLMIRMLIIGYVFGLRSERLSLVTSRSTLSG